MPDNYLKMEQQARDLFLKVDQQAMTDTWGLEADEDFIYPVFFGQRLKIDRKTAEISAAPAAPEEGAGYFIPKSTVNDSLILFDILSRTGTAPKASGQWASISMLGGHIGAGHDRTLRNEPQAAYFAGQTEKLAEACSAAGGEPFSKADVGYALPVFRDLKILFQFWDADDEFPASIKYLFDTNALAFMHYETLWYVMNAAYSRIRFEFDKL
ncbi:MAG: DUF3786 domain-containing protein [Firmicutes bacterium]|nr:DUF3786 domain-containing protein [Bacillota bacterium]